MRYGLLDTVDHVWIGDEKGPMLFDDEHVARLSAEICSVKLGWARSRIQARLFEEAAPLHLRDHVDPVKTAEELADYLDRRERGLL